LTLTDRRDFWHRYEVLEQSLALVWATARVFRPDPGTCPRDEQTSRGESRAFRTRSVPRDRPATSRRKDDERHPPGRRVWGPEPVAARAEHQQVTDDDAETHPALHPGIDMATARGSASDLRQAGAAVKPDPLARSGSSGCRAPQNTVATRSFLHREEAGEQTTDPEFSSGPP